MLAMVGPLLTGGATSGLRGAKSGALPTKRMELHLLARCPAARLARARFAADPWQGSGLAADPGGAAAPGIRGGPIMRWSIVAQVRVRPGRMAGRARRPPDPADPQTRQAKR